MKIIKHILAKTIISFCLLLNASQGAIIIYTEVENEFSESEKIKLFERIIKNERQKNSKKSLENGNFLNNGNLIENKENLIWQNKIDFKKVKTLEVPDVIFDLIIIKLSMIDQNTEQVIHSIKIDETGYINDYFKVSRIITNLIKGFYFKNYETVFNNYKSLALFLDNIILSSENNTFFKKSYYFVEKTLLQIERESKIEITLKKQLQDIFKSGTNIIEFK